MTDLAPLAILALGAIGTAWGAMSIAIYWATSDYTCSVDYWADAQKPYEVKGPPE